jgi:hypothetical protein
LKVTEVQTDEAGSDLLSLHHGEALWRFANTYQTLVLTIVEAVQNAIDASASTVFVGIDPVGRQVVVLDDGEGVTQEKFRTALMSVGRTIKRRGSLGRFGLGLISPLNKCQTYVFTSQPGDEEKANRWTFVGEEIRLQHAEILIPIEHLEQLPRVPRRFAKAAARFNASWRTQVLMEGVTEDKVVGAADLDDVVGHIRSRLGIGMRRKGTTVHVFLNDGRGHVDTREINPADFLGEPLEKAVYEDNDCGRVEFELYRARKSEGKRKGEVFVMELDGNYPVTWREFMTQAMGAKWLEAVKEAFDVLNSGFFEGIIRVQNIELAAERNKFVLNNALAATYLVIHQWYQDYGKEYFEDETETRREERYKELGEKSLERLLDSFRDNPAFASIGQRLLDLLPSEPDADQALARKGQGTGSAPPSDADREPKAKRKRKANVVRPPRDSSGQQQDQPSRFTLRFAYEMLEGNPNLWEFDPETGVLTFNIRHPIWVKLDETKGRHTTRNDKQIMHLQEWLALQVLLMLARHGSLDFDLEVERYVIDQQTPFYAEMFILAAGRR